VSNYKIGAYEALEWAWHMLRNYRDQPGGVEEARKAIQQTLMDMGKGDAVNFRDSITQLKYND
jgi:hypothetical protein